MGEPTMKLKCLVGPYAGQEIEYPQSVGEALLASGQAERPAPETATPKKEAAVLPEPEKRTVKKAASKSKKKATKKAKKG